MILIKTERKLALAFDFRTQGESEGAPPNYESPSNKSEDIKNAISYLRSLNWVDAERVGVAGICAGGSYSAQAAVSDRRIRALATINGYLSLREFAGYNPFITDEIRTGLLKRSNEDRQRFYETSVSENADILMGNAERAEDLKIPASEADKRDIFDYYYARVNKCWPNYNHRFATMSYEALLDSHALGCAKDLVIPYLGIVGSEAFTKPYTERFAAEILHEDKCVEVIESARHIQTYDNEEYVDKAIGLLSMFFHDRI